MNHALRVLEFDKILERLQEHCETPLGAAHSTSLQPSFVEEEVWVRLEETREAYQLLATDPPPSLAALRDPRQLLKRASKQGQLSGQELYWCAESLSVMRQLKAFLKSKGPELPRLKGFVDSLTEAPKVEEKLFSSLDGGGYVLDSASSTLESLRQRKAGAAARIVERIQSYVSGRTRDLLSDPIYTVRDGRYVLPLKAENRGKIKGIVHDTSATGATVFLEPDDVLQLGNSLRELEAAERQEITRILVDLSSRLGNIGQDAIGGIEAASAFDAIVAKAKLAFADRGAEPQMRKGANIELQGAKHPLLDAEKVVPLDIAVGVDSNILITGPNTGGKTVAIKVVGLSIAMAQSGLYPPALDVKLGVFSGLWADIGDEQSLQQSLSTFSGHIKNIVDALKHMKPGTMMLFDELGAGTDPAEGSALAIAILLEMQEAGCSILASTHYGELKAFAYEQPGFNNAAMEFDAKTLRPTYRLLMGSPGASQALRIAERYGLPSNIIDRARAGLGQQTQNLSQMMEQLDRAQRQARIAQGEADRRLNELNRTKQEADKKLAEAEEIRNTVRKRAADNIEAALREIRLEAAQIFDDLKKNPTKGIEQARQRLKDLQTVGGEFVEEMGPSKRPVKLPVGVQLKKGMSVRIDGYPQVGTLLSEPGSKDATVQLGAIKMTVPMTRVRPSEEKAVTVVKAKVNSGLARAQTATTEIHLRHMRAEEAEDDLSKFIDDAVLAGLPSVRIVHGKGEGILRRITQDMLRRHPHVKSYRDGEPGEGGHGVTIAVIR